MLVGGWPVVSCVPKRGRFEQEYSIGCPLYNYRVVLVWCCIGEGASCPISPQVGTGASALVDPLRDLSRSRPTWRLDEFPDQRDGAGLNYNEIRSILGKSYGLVGAIACF